MIYIKSGIFKNRSIVLCNSSNLKPTLNVMRELLFNWLNNICIYYDNFISFIDCFSGSGILGFEVVSNFVSFGLFIEHDFDIFKILLS